MCNEYDVKVQEYGPGMIVWHTCPLEKSEAYKNGAMSTRPVLIVGQQRLLGAARYQVMALTTNLNNFGVRVLVPNLDNMNSVDWKPAVILCMEVWTVDRNSLERIIGCVPKRVLDKCVKAYGWVLGLNDELPDFIEQSEEAMMMLGDGTPAKYIPVSLRNVKSPSPVLTPPPAGTLPKPTPEPTPSEPAPTEPAPSAPEPTGGDSDNHPLLDRIGKYMDTPIKLSPANRQIAEELSINEQFDLYVGRLSIRSLAAQKSVTVWGASQIAKYINYRNAKGVKNLIEDIRTNLCDTRFLTGRNEMLYRLIDTKQMQTIRRSPRGYQKDIGRFGLDFFKDTLIGIVYGSTLF